MARRELNEQRKKDGLETIRDPTFFELVASYALVLIGGLIMGILCGIAAVAVALLFLSKSFGLVAQLGSASAVVGFLGFGLISMIGDGMAAWSAKRKARRRVQ